MFSFSNGYFQVPCWFFGVYISWGSSGELRDKQLPKHCHSGEYRRESMHDKSWRELIHASKIHQSHLRFYVPSAKTKLLWQFDVQKRVADIFGKSSLLLLPWFKQKFPLYSNYSGQLRGGISQLSWMFAQNRHNMPMISISMVSHVKHKSYQSLGCANNVVVKKFQVTYSP